MKGRKRHLLVDTEGLVLKVKITGADVHDQPGLRQLLSPASSLQASYPRMSKLWLDQGYQGEPVRDWVKCELGWDVELTSGLSARTWSRINDEVAVRVRGFAIQARRWVVERTFGWLNRFRLLSKEYTVRIANAEADIYIAMLRIMSRRLARLRLAGTPNLVPAD